MNDSIKLTAPVTGKVSAPTLTVTRLSFAEWLRLETEWDDLQRRMLPRTPFASPIWMSHWWTHFRRSGSFIQDEFYGHCVRDTESRLIAVAPLMRTTLYGFGIPLLRIVQFLGNDSSLTEIRGLICHEDDHSRAVQTLAEQFLQQSSQWDVLRWSGLREPIAAYRINAGRDQLRPGGQLTDYMIDMPDSWSGIRTRVSANMRKNLRRPYELLERDGHDFTMKIRDRQQELAPAIKRFLALHVARSQADDMGVYHPNKFAASHERAFLAAVLADATDKDQLKFFELQIGSRVVASRITFRLGPVLYLYFAGYEPKWRSYSVMTILMAEIIKWAIDNGVRQVNLSTGTDQSKLRWKPTEIIFHDATQASPTLRARLAFRVFEAYEMLSRSRDIRHTLRKVMRKALRLLRKKP